jgi:hypothetical protein
MFHIFLDDGARKLLRNVHKLLPYYTAHIPEDSHLRPQFVLSLNRVSQSCAEVVIVIKIHVGFV